MLILLIKNPETHKSISGFFINFVLSITKLNNMRRALIIILAVCQILTTEAQKKNSKQIEKASKAIFKIETTTKEGVKQNGHGFFISENGEAVSDYSLFKNAQKAVVTTSGGETFQVIQILGADDFYDVIRFKVGIPKKTDFLTIAKSSPDIGTTVYIPPSGEENNAVENAISEITKVKSVYDYYTIDATLSKSQESYPILNDAGEVFAITQQDASGKGKTYGISVPYINSLQITTTDIFNKTYTELGVRMAWLPSAEDAQLLLILYASIQDAPTYLETLNDFIVTFPNYPDGYSSRAIHYAYNRENLSSDKNEQLQMLDLAMKDLESAEKYTKDKGKIYYDRASLIFEVITNDSTLQHKGWDIKTASENIQKAILTEDLYLYRMLEGDIEFFKGDYEKAYNSYSIINQGPEASTLSYYFAAKSKQQMPEVNYIEIINLMDSAIAKSSADEVINIILENVDLKLQAGLFEEAVKDYDMYYTMLNGNVSDLFYYYREQAKFRSGDFEGALKDIDLAISANNENELYYAEKASVCIRLQDYTKAKESAEKAIELQPEFASAYRILGVSLLRQNNKTDACVHLNKAKELGDPVADRLINDNCK